MAVKLIFSLLFLCGCHQLFAKATVYDGRDGLNGNDISAVAKDSRGMMWIGTFNGLNIYDGYTFTKIPGVLSNRHITALAIHPSGEEMLVGTELGLYIVRSSQPEHYAGNSWSKGRNDMVCR